MAQAILSEPVQTGNPVLSVEALQPIVYRGQPVIPTSVLASLYETEEDYVRRNFNRNRSRFVEGRHFFFITGDELRALKHSVSLSDAVGDSGSQRPAAKISPRVNTLTAWTARGAARHAKMLDTDKAWDVFELLEENYFSRRPAVAEPVAPVSTTITPSQQQELQNIVAAKASAFPKEAWGRVKAQIWSRMHNKFKVAKYDQLPAELFPEAVEYLVGMAVRGSLPEPAAQQPANALPATGTSAIYWDIAADMHAGVYRAMQDFRRAINEDILAVSVHLKEKFQEGTPELRNRTRVVQTMHSCVNRTADAIEKELEVMIDAARGIDGWKALVLE